MNPQGRANASASQAASSPSPTPATAVVLNQVHVSCFITAANRATPVFEIAPERHCVRVVNKSLGDQSAATTSAAGPHSGASGNANASSNTSASSAPSAEWDFHTLFASTSASHAVDFYREITQPAFRNVCDGWNTNIVAWGVHPTQKYRLLFGKSTGSSHNSSAIRPTSAQNTVSTQQQALENEKEVLELYGQLGGLLHEFFQSPRLTASVRSQQTSIASLGCRVGISSWIIVNNQVIDLLKSAMSPPSSAHAQQRPSTSPPLSFVSLEAKTFTSACKILQTAKTNRIVMKQNAEHAHFFLRLAFFYNGQVSTMHFVDLIDLKDFKDQASIQEKQELFDILHEIRQPPMSPRYAMASPITSQTQTRAGGASGATSGMSGPSTPKYKTRKMVLSNFILPLLTANAKTFLYANVIDSRTSLRESVQLLNAVANVKGFSCTCKRLRGVEFMQLGFQTPPDDFLLHPVSSDGESKQHGSAYGDDDVAAKAMAAVATGESLLSRLASSSPSASTSFGSTSLPSFTTPAAPFSASNLSSILSSGRSSPLASPSSSTINVQLHPSQPSQRKDSFSSVPMESETLSWLESFSQRKRDILGGKIDTIAPLPSYQQLLAESAFFSFGTSEGNEELKPESSLRYASVDSPAKEFRYKAPPEAATSSTRDMIQQTSADLLERLRAAMALSPDISRVRRTSSEPLPIADADIGAHGGDTTVSFESPSSPQRTAQQIRHAAPDSPYSTSYPAPAPPSHVSPPFRAPTNTATSVSSPPYDLVASSPAHYWATAGSTGVQPLDFGNVVDSASKSVSFSRPPAATSPPQHHSSTASPSPMHLQQRGRQLYETLERANVPSQATAPANLDGLDAVTVTKIQATEAALLRKNYDALLTIVQEQQQLREMAEANAAEAVHDLDEVRASFEVQIENMKLSNVALRSKVRALEKQSALPKVFDQYEQELQLLLKEVQQLRDRNVALELKVCLFEILSGLEIDCLNHFLTNICRMACR